MYSTVEKIVEHSHPDAFLRDFKILKQKKKYIYIYTDLHRR